jgi:hypothetical protein
MKHKKRHWAVELKFYIILFIKLTKGSEYLGMANEKGISGSYVVSSFVCSTTTPFNTAYLDAVELMYQYY